MDHENIFSYNNRHCLNSWSKAMLAILDSTDIEFFITTEILLDSAVLRN